MVETAVNRVWTAGWCSRLAASGEVLIQTRSHSAWGGGVTAQMYLPIDRSRVWAQVTNYSRWVEYFPDIIHSEVLSGSASEAKRLYQVARKTFLMFSAQVEIYLRVCESAPSGNRQHLQFRLEKGTFTDFSADLTLEDYQSGTLLTYDVQATPTIPVPSLLIQEAMRFDLPANMRSMRQAICDRSAGNL